MVGLAGCLGATQYTVADARVTSDPSPLQLDVEILDSEAIIQSPARLRFTLTNTAERPIRVRNTGLWPLGMLELSTVTDPADESSGSETILWNEEYRKSSKITVQSRSSYSVSQDPLTQPLDSGQAVTATYEIHGDDIVRASTYYVYGEFDAPILTYAADTNSNFEAYLPRVEVAIQSKGLLPSF
ncbi:hypothetical protein [Halocalculus aciditolerans]|uniref:DUF8130 domain-containing protein n=1 Tax=Halocalculus aciditolerans TaxID=1383812 RepID=A0A830FEG3_9EURY|nr:hypothetical protein [Halocalculus aciditolerans]GGL66720.1 hypothetical protein GCM10009039_25840 [Halocalculus aciditolerans]